LAQPHFVSQTCVGIREAGYPLLLGFRRSYGKGNGTFRDEKRCPLKFKVDRVRDTGVFYGSDEVRGTVEIRGPLTFPYYDDSKVHIVFAGSSETAHALKGHVYDDKAIFFQDEKVLFAGIVTSKLVLVRPGSFPSGFQSRQNLTGHKPRSKRKKRYESFLMTPHPLPQSTALSGQLPHQWQALVSYTLHAKVSGKWGCGRIEELSRSSPNHAVTPRLPS